MRSNTQEEHETSVSVDFEGHLLERIRLAAVAGLNRIRGGLEIGGVLYGLRGNGKVHVTAFAPLQPEYAHGPTFTLSPADEERLERLINHSRPAGLDAVGWYCSRRKDDLDLGDKHLRLFDHFFPRTGDATLIVRPSQFGPSEARLYWRETGHVLDSRDLTLAPVSRSAGAIPVPAPPPAPAFPVGSPSVRPLPAAPRPAEMARPGYRRAPPPSLRPPPPHRAPPAGRPRSSWQWIVPALLLAMLAGFALVRLLLLHSSPPHLGLVVRDEGGQLRIEWDRAAIANARAAVLDIRDGAAGRTLDLDAALLSHGSFYYARASGDVTVTLRAHLPKLVEDTARFVGSPPAPPPLATPFVDSTETITEAQSRTADDARQPTRGLRGNSAAKAWPARMLREFRAPLEQGAKAPPSLESPTLESSTPAPLGFQPPDVRLPIEMPAAPPENRGNFGREWRFAGPTWGRLIWTGLLERGWEVIIEDGRASTGSLRGEFPSGPFRVTVYPADFTTQGLIAFTSSGPPEVREAASGGNGWNATVFRRDPNRATDIVVLEAPAAQNGWRRLSVRAIGRDVSLILVDWRTMPDQARLANND